MFHKEGHQIIIVSFLAVVIIVLLVNQFINPKWVRISFQLLFLISLIIILRFFRNPTRATVLNENHIIAPSDGKIVTIKKVYEKEYFKEDRILISIFMSINNVHVTRYPISGKVKYSKYHEGKYLVAFHPKSSEKNERTSIVVNNEKTGDILYRQIAGAVARRIVNYAKENENVVQGEDAGFIKFGSRIDVFLPLNSNILVELNQKVRGGESILASTKDEK